jgi:hypothetical protein
MLNREVILGLQNADVKIIAWLEYLAQKDKQWVMYRRSACTQVLFLCEAQLGFFHFLEIVTGTFSWSEYPSTAWLVPSTVEDLACWKQVFSGR